MNPSTRLQAILIALVITTLATVVTPQSPDKAVRFYEGLNLPGCGEYGLITSLMNEVMTSQKDARGLVVVYAGKEPDRLGNLLGYIDGARRWVAMHGVPESKISYVLANGHTFGYEEYWILPEGALPPQFEEAEFSWKELRSTYLFSTTCTSCEPSYPELGLDQPFYRGFARVLNDNPNYRGRVRVNSYAELASVRKKLSEFGLERHRYSLVIKKESKSGDDALITELYIVP